MADFSSYAWDLETFSFPGPGADGPIFDAAWYEPDPNAGGMLVVCGKFSSIGGIDATNVAMFDGAQWYDLGIEPLCYEAASLAVVPTENGQRLFLLSDICLRDDESNAFGHVVSEWDGASWSHHEVAGAGARELTYFPRDGALALCFGGSSEFAFPVSSTICDIDGVWTQIAGKTQDIATFTTPAGTYLYLARSSGLHRWNGSEQTDASTGLPPGFRCQELGVVTRNGQQELYLATQTDLYRFVEPTWEWVTAIPAGTVEDIAGFVDGTSLLLSGKFSDPNYPDIDGVARWDGNVWSAMGTHDGFVLTAVQAGDETVIVGEMTLIDNKPVQRIARWMGGTWTALPGTRPGMGLNARLHAQVHADTAAVFDDGNGPRLFVGGRFATAGSLTVGGLAAWDGDSWHTIPGWESGQVTAIEVHDDGRGAALYVGGRIASVDGHPAYNVVRWDGSDWEALPFRNSLDVRQMTSHDGDLFVGYYNNSPTTSRCEIWDGSQWRREPWVDLEVTDLSAITVNGVKSVFAVAWNSPLILGLASSWEDMGLTGFADFPNFVCMTEYQDTLILGGDFEHSSGAMSIAQFDGDEIHDLGFPLEPFDPWALNTISFPTLIRGLGTYNVGSSEYLVAAGQYNGSPTLFDGQTWTSLATQASATQIIEFQGDLYFLGISEVEGRPVGGLTRWYCPGKQADADGDLAVTLSDLAILLGAFGACPEDVEWDARADLNRSGCVDLADLASVLSFYGSDCSLP